ncbi:hypothetical protein RCL1_004831 [Eukaryota sp. TZLM3-RCL]
MMTCQPLVPFTSGENACVNHLEMQAINHFNFDLPCPFLSQMTLFDDIPDVQVFISDSFLNISVNILVQNFISPIIADIQCSFGYYYDFPINQKVDVNYLNYGSNTFNFLIELPSELPLNDLFFNSHLNFKVKFSPKNFHPCLEFPPNHLVPFQISKEIVIPFVCSNVFSFSPPLSLELIPSIGFNSFSEINLILELNLNYFISFNFTWRFTGFGIRTPKMTCQCVSLPCDCKLLLPNTVKLGNQFLIDYVVETELSTNLCATPTSKSISGQSIVDLNCPTFSHHNLTVTPRVINSRSIIFDLFLDSDFIDFSLNFSRYSVNSNCILKSLTGKKCPKISDKNFEIPFASVPHFEYFMKFSFSPSFSDCFLTCIFELNPIDDVANPHYCMKNFEKSVIYSSVHFEYSEQIFEIFNEFLNKNPSIFNYLDPHIIVLLFSAIVLLTSFIFCISFGRKIYKIFKETQQ